jgi:hypothetical protein
MAFLFKDKGDRFRELDEVGDEEKGPEVLNQPELGRSPSDKAAAIEGRKAMLRQRSFDMDTSVGRQGSLDKSLGYESSDQYGATRPVVKKQRSISEDDKSDTLGGGDESYFLDIIASGWYAKLMDFLPALGNRYLPTVERRCFIYIVTLVILSLFLFGQGSNKSSSLYQLTPQNWYQFLLIVMGIDLFSCLLDETIFFLLDFVWFGPDEIRLYARCLNGPLGFIITVSFINGFLADMAVPTAIPTWNPFMSAVALVWTCYTARLFFQQLNYNKLMMERFSGRIEKMTMETVILSCLASPEIKRVDAVSETRLRSNSAAVATPNKDQRTPEKSNIPSPSPSHDAAKQTVTGSPKLAGSPKAAPTAAAKAKAPQTPAQRKSFTNIDYADSLNSDKAAAALNILRSSKFASKWKEIVSHQKKESLTVFADVVSKSKDEGDEEEEEHDDKLMAKKTFWSRVTLISKGHVKIRTINGNLTMRAKKHAASFGKRLYTFLSKGGRCKITGKRVAQIIRAAHGDEENIDEMVKHALFMFNLDETKDIQVATRKSIIETCETVFVNHNTAASSLTDFGELRKSLMNVLNVLFWILMLVVAQMVLKIDTATLFAPVLTLVFAISFAVGPMVGNCCMAIGFVLFTLSYDVGDRVAFGVGPSKIIGNVKRITLLQTTILTVNNEQVSIITWMQHISVSLASLYA